MANNSPIETVYVDGQWKNVRQGGQRASSVHDTKADAVDTGRTLAQNSGTEHLIKNKNGQIGSRNSYGNDPYPPNG